MKRLLMVKQHILVTDGNHVVVEHTLVNDIRVLQNIHHVFVAQTMQTRNRLAGFKGLTSREFLRLRTVVSERVTAVHKNLNTSVPILTAQTRVVGCAFVTKMLVVGQVSVVSKILAVRKGRFQNIAGHLWFQ